MDLLKRIARPRPAGTAINKEITDYIGTYLKDLGYEIKKVPFDCKVWEPSESFLVTGGTRLALHVSPFSEPFIGTGKAVVARNLEELKEMDCKGKILFLTEDLAQEPLQPKDYPFYYPDEHKAIIDCLEAKNPCAVIAVTGETEMSGQKPFYLIEDGNFHIPVASLDKDEFAVISDKINEKEVELSVVSQNKSETAYQIIASRKVGDPKGTIVICAHMDSKYNTDGALDNASGVVTMLYAAKEIKTDKYDIDIVPFNTEEYYDPQGELIYLNELQKSGKEVSLLINIDAVAHTGSNVAVASFNFNESEQLDLNNLMSSCPGVVSGDPWYAGDHAAFAFGGTKCVLVYASDLFEGCLTYTHCPKDTTDLVDENLINDAVRFICKLVDSYK